MCENVNIFLLGRVIFYFATLSKDVLKKLKILTKLYFQKIGNLLSAISSV
jgi:hypothetical protein